MATGLGGRFPLIPKPSPGQENYKDIIEHSSQHESGAPWTGKKALVVGTGSSGHDISLDFFNNDADTTLLQCSPTSL